MAEFITILILLGLIYGIYKCLRWLIRTEFSPAKKRRRARAMALMQEILTVKTLQPAMKTEMFSYFDIITPAIRQKAVNDHLNSLPTTTEAELIYLDERLAYLNVTPQEVIDSYQPLRWRFYADALRQGQFTKAFQDQANFRLNPDEKVYLIVVSAIIDKQNKRLYDMGNIGQSVKIGSLNYHIGRSVGMSVNVKEDVQGAFGQLSITNQRLVFAGETKAFEVLPKKLINYSFVDDILHLNLKGRNEPRRVQVESQTKESVIAAIELWLKQH